MGPHWAEWRKASRSSDQGDMCVELAVAADIVAIRDSTDPDGPRVILNLQDFRRFTDTLKNT